MIGKILTAKAAAIAGVIVLSGGVAAAATGTLPDPVQNTASTAAEHVGVHIPQGDHGADVSGVAHDKSGTEDGSNHGEDVSTVARDNHGHATTTTVVGGEEDNSGPGNSNGAGKSEDSHSSDNSKGKGSNGADDPAGHDSGDDNNDDSVTTTTLANTPTTVKADDSGHDSGDDNPGGQSGKGGHGSDD